MVRHYERAETGCFRPKLTQAQVELIRSLALAGESHGSIARRFGVERSGISRIVSGTRRRTESVKTEGPQERSGPA